MFAAKKKDGGLRPVAVGETLCRLTAKCLVFKVADEAAAFLMPLVRRGGAGGREAIVHTTRATLRDASIPLEERFCLLVHFENSFNHMTPGVSRGDYKGLQGTRRL